MITVVRTVTSEGTGRISAVLAFLLLALPLGAQPFGGIIAQQGIDFNGQSVTLDSYDSSTNTHSIWQTNLLYRGQPYGLWSHSLSYVSNNIASNPSRTADVHVFSSAGLLNAGTGIIAGYIETGPTGFLSIKNGGYVGDLAWIFTSNGQIPGNAYQGIQPGHAGAIPNINFNSFNLPNPTNRWQTTWASVPTMGSGSMTNGRVINIGGVWTNTGGNNWIEVGGSNYTVNASKLIIGGVMYEYVITNRVENTNWVYYTMNQIDDSIFIDAPRVVLYLPYGTKNSGTYYVTLNTNCDVQIWTKGDVNAAGNAIINNLTGYAQAFSLFDVSGFPVSVKLIGDSGEAGYYYLPSSHVLFAGGGSGNQDFIGAVVCYDLSINGKMNFHWDESFGIALPPGIVFPLTNRIVPIGSNVTFSITAGMLPLNYQWLDNHTNPISGATDLSMTLSNVQLSDSGIYTVVVTNLYGAATSSASLTVLNPTATLNLPSFNRTNQNFQFSIVGISNLNYTIQASTDLVNWVSLQTNVSPFTFSITNGRSYPQRFYRSVYYP